MFFDRVSASMEFDCVLLMPGMFRRKKDKVIIVANIITVLVVEPFRDHAMLCRSLTHYGFFTAGCYF